MMMAVSWMVVDGCFPPSAGAPYRQRGEREGGWSGQGRQRHSRRPGVILLLSGIFANNRLVLPVTELHFVRLQV